MTPKVTITGNTYPVKELLRGLGGRWNADQKGWDVPADKADEARRIVAGVKSSRSEGRPTHRPRTCACGAKLTGGYSKCRDCYYHDQECDAMGLSRDWDA